MPEKLHELQRLWLIEAVKYNVMPLDDRRPERFNPDMAGRPTLIKGDSQLLFGGMGRLTENCVVTMKNKSFSITAEVEVPATGAEGVIIAQGGAFGGLSLYAKGGKAKFAYNLLGLKVSYDRGGGEDPGGHASGADGVRLRRRRPRQGRQRHALLRRQESGRGTHRRHGARWYFPPTKRPTSGARAARR